jgi:hypothetical protein
VCRVPADNKKTATISVLNPVLTQLNVVLKKGDDLYYRVTIYPRSEKVPLFSKISEGLS